MIQLKGVSKLYQMGDEKVHALINVDLTINANEYVAITGTSGSGKSTMMHILGCLDSSSTGSYILADRDVTGLSPKQLAEIRNREIGFIFQSFNLLPRLSVLDNAIQPLIYQGIKYKERREMAMEQLKLVGLGERMNHMPNQLSGGQRQRVAIARALVTKPSILLADEPTGNLDSATTEDVLELFNQLHSNGQTIVMVTHEPEIADQCQRVVQLKDGQIIKDYYN